MAQSPVSLLLLASFIVAIDAIGWTQNITVRGSLKCKGKYVPDTVVQLWDKETMKKDDLMESFTTDKRGTFFIVGYETQISTIKPYIRIEHTCAAKTGCHKVTEITIAPLWIGKQKDLAFVNLEQESNSDNTDAVMNVWDECPKPKKRSV